MKEMVVVTNYTVSIKKHIQQHNTMSLFEETSMIIPNHLIQDRSIAASLDRGCTLTKIVYFTEESIDKLTLHFVVSSNNEFESTLQWLRKKLETLSKIDQNKYTMRLTGAGGDKYRKQIEETIGLKTDFIAEFPSQANGAKFFVSNFEDRDFCFPDVRTTETENLRNIPKWIIDAKKVRDDQNDDTNFPCLFLFAGSGLGFNQLTEDAQMKFLTFSMAGGRTLMGAARMLLGTDNYDEVMELASKGSADLNSKTTDVFAAGEGSEYPFPEEKSIFAFGNVRQDFKDLKKEDIAASLLCMFVMSLLPLIEMNARNIKARKVYIGGHLFKSEVLRKTMILHNMSIMSSPDRYCYLSNGHTGALGAMITSPEENQQMKLAMREEITKNLKNECN